MICYFFSGDRYIRVTRQETGPGSVDTGYPASIKNWNWGAFGANGIDAALYSGSRCFFFSGAEYIRVTRNGTGPGSIDPGYPAPIKNWQWGSFGENGIDAALYSGFKCYFFSGDQYIRVSRSDIGAGQVDPGYPAPIKNWGWGEFGKNGINGALYSGGKCYFFAGDQYIRVSRGDTGPGVVDPGYPAPIKNWGWGDFGVQGIDAALFSGMDDPSCSYPNFNATALPMDQALDNIVSDAWACTGFYLDTVEEMHGGRGNKGANHAQGLARTQVLPDGSVWWFLTYSNIGGAGSVSSFKYTGPLQGAHVAETNPRTDPAAVAPMGQWYPIGNDHPCDMDFLGDVNNAGSGYLFIAEQGDAPGIGIYRWFKESFDPIGFMPIDLDPRGAAQPNFILLDKVGDYYVLGVAGGDSKGDKKVGMLFKAKTLELFPFKQPGSLQPSAFQPVSPDDILDSLGPIGAATNTFSFVVVNTQASQTKVVRDSTGQRYLLGFRSNPDDQESATDYIDVYPLEFSRFNIGAPWPQIHVTFRPGNTSFASTGTHYVDSIGRILVSTSYRWAEKDLPDTAGYVSRVDELASG